MKIPFDIKYRSKIESGKYSVQTTDGRNVRIICWDKQVYGGRHEIVALVPTPEGGTETGQMYNPDGTLIASTWNEKFKLVILTDEPELSEFEKAVGELLNDNSDALYSDKAIKEYAKGLLDLARKELEPEVLERLEEAYKNQDEVVYENGKRDGEKEGYEKAMKEFKELPALTWPPQPIQTYFPPCYHGGPCTNPQHDCINCPRQSSIGINTATGTSTSKLEG